MHDTTDLRAACDTAVSNGARVQVALIWPCCSHMDHDLPVESGCLKEEQHRVAQGEGGKRLQPCVQRGEDGFAEGMVR